MNRAYEKGLVNVLVPCYNGEAYINRFFRSFEKQTYRPIELILVNDGSADESDTLIRKEIETLSQTGIKVNYIVQENRGLGGAINRAIKEIRGEYFVWFNIDDVLEPECIETMVTFLNANPEYALVRPNVSMAHEDAPDVITGCINDKNPEAAKPDLFENALNEKNFTFGCSMIRSAVFDEVNPDREIYPSRKGQNWQLLLPVFYKHKSGYIERPLYTVIVQNQSTSVVTGYEKTLAQKREHEKILLETLARMDLPEEERNAYRESVRLRYGKDLFWLSVTSGDFVTAKEYYRFLKSRHALSKGWKKVYAKRFFKIEYWSGLKKKLFSRKKK